MSRIVFYGFNNIEPGGVQNLIVNLTLQLYLKKIKSIVFCSEESYVYSRLSRYPDSFIHIDTGIIPSAEYEKYVAKDDILFVTNFTTNLRFFRKKNPRLFFWNVLPTTFRKANDILFFRMPSLTKHLINYLIASDGLAFMDSACSDSIFHDFDLNISPIYLPIPISIKEKINKKKLETNQLTLTYLGRGDAIWKIYPVVKLIQDLEKLPNSNLIRFIIITNEKDLFQKFFQNYGLKKIDISYKLDLYGNELSAFLSNFSDLHFAMGTSALEAGALGIPTILLDASKIEFPVDYKYKWLFNVENYSLGNFIDEFGFSQNNRYEIKEILSTTEKEWTALSEKTYAYVKNNHDIDRIAIDFYNLCQKSNTTLNQFSKFSLRQYDFFQFIRNLYVKKRIKLKLNSASLSK